MAATTPEQRLDLTQDGVRISNAIRSGTWIDAARQHCWLAGRGPMYVPAYNPGVAIAAGSSATFNWRTRPRYQTARYCLSVVLTAETPAAATLTLGGTSYSIGVPEKRNARAETFFIDGASLAEVELTLAVTIAAVGSTVDVECISIEGVPRAFLAVDNNDLGVERLDFFRNVAIEQDNIATQVLARQAELRDACRRVGGFQHGFGDLTPWSTAVAGPTAIFDDSFSLLGRFGYSGSTTSTWSWRILAYCSDGTTKGDVILANTSGGAGLSTIAIPLSTTTATWLDVTGGAAATFTSDCEDPTAADGRRSSRWDEHTITVTRTGGAGTIYIESISIWEN